MQNQDKIILNLSIDEINTILTALGDRPYVQVYELIQKIHGQVGEQMQQEQGNSVMSPPQDVE